MREEIRIGTRSSALAVWQSRYVKDALESTQRDCAIEIIHIKTLGDKILDAPLSKIGDKGLFTKELEQALLDNRIDCAVHSLKDVTTTLPGGLTLGAITGREDIRDVFISHPSKKYSGLEALPEGAVIATGSLRRKSQLLAYRSDLNIRDIRGNVNTRLQKLDESEWDGMLLASAGMVRMGLHDRMTQVIDPTIILPAVGQGALAVEIREDDMRMIDILAPIEDDFTRQSTTAERALLKRLEGGCQIPVGAWGRIEKGELVLDAVVGSLNGDRIIRDRMSDDAGKAAELGVRLAETLLRKGADKILAEIRGAEG
jgi:hydroxymethylbilane synthase